MSFEEALARCLAAIEGGETVADCLIRFPRYADELEPLLQLARQIRSRPQTLLPPAAFVHGRATLAAHARYQQSVRAPFQSTAVNGAVAPAVQQHWSAAQTTRLPPVRPQRSPLTIRSFHGLLVSLLFLLTLLTGVRSVGASLPGAAIYPVKTLLEEMQGYLMVAAGQRALWHARQAERRLYELDQLARQGSTADAGLIVEINENVQSALAATATMPAADRTSFLQLWLSDLEQAWPATATQETTVVTLGQVIATVAAAADQEIAPTVLHLVVTATNLPPTAIETPTVSPTALASATKNPARVELPTPTHTPELFSAPAINPMPATATTLATPLDFDNAGPLPTSIFGEILQTDEEDADEESSAPARATDTPTSTPVPTHMATPTNSDAPPAATATPLPPPTATWTPAFTPSPLPTDTTLPTATPSETLTEQTKTPTATRTPAPTTAASPTVETSPTAASSLTPSPVSTTPAGGTNTPVATDTALPNLTPTSWWTPLPLPTRPTDSVTPVATNTPAPSPAPPTAQPTDTPQPTAVEETPVSAPVVTSAPEQPTVTPTKSRRKS